MRHSRIAPALAIISSLFSLFWIGCGAGGGVKLQPISGTPAPPPSGAPPLCMVSYSSLDVPKSTATLINSINNHGAMVGSYVDQQSIQHGFLYDNSKITSVDGPNAVLNTTSGGPNGTQLTAIADNGLVAGDQRIVIPGAGGTYAQALLYQNGQFTIFNPQASNAIPTGVNSAGVVVGVGDLVGCCNVSWIRNPDGNLSQFFQTNAMIPAMPEDINDKGLIVADGPLLFTPNFTPPPFPNPTTSANGTFSTFTVPGTTGGATPLGLNNNADVAGSYADANSPGTFWGWMKTSGNSCTLSVPGAKFTIATDLDDSGRVVGYYSDASGVQHGFVAK